MLVYLFFLDIVFFFQAEDGIRDAQESRGLGDVYKRQLLRKLRDVFRQSQTRPGVAVQLADLVLRENDPVRLSQPANPESGRVHLRGDMRKNSRGRQIFLLLYGARRARSGAACQTRHEDSAGCEP